MKYIITGATSFLGRAVAGRLKTLGNEVTALRHSFEDEPEKLPKSADVWLHFAWAGKGSAGRSDAAVQEFNVSMSMAALKKAEELGCRRFVFAGSQAEYGFAQDGSLKREDGDAVPVSEYAKAKLEFGTAAARYCEHSAMDYVHMRLFSVYGPGDHETSLISTLVRKAGEKALAETGAAEEALAEKEVMTAADSVKAALTAGVTESAEKAAADSVKAALTAGVAASAEKAAAVGLTENVATEEAATAAGAADEKKVAEKAANVVLLGPCSQNWNFMYIDDAADAVIRICERFGSDAGAGGIGNSAGAGDAGSIVSSGSRASAGGRANRAGGCIINVGSADNRRLSEYVTEAASILGNLDRLRFAARGNNAEGSADLTPDISRLKALGHSDRVSFAEGIKRTGGIR